MKNVKIKLRHTGKVSQIASSLMVSSSPGIRALHILNEIKFQSLPELD
jgi:hypothetical protein